MTEPRQIWFEKTGVAGFMPIHWTGWAVAVVFISAMLGVVWGAIGLIRLSGWQGWEWAAAPLVLGLFVWFMRICDRHSRRFDPWGRQNRRGEGSVG